MNYAINFAVSLAMAWAVVWLLHRDLWHRLSHLRREQEQCGAMIGQIADHLERSGLARVTRDDDGVPVDIEWL